MNPFGDRPKITTNIAFETGEDMSLEVTVTIKSGSGHGAPWHVVKGDPKEVLDYLTGQGPVKGSDVTNAMHAVSAWSSEEFQNLNPGKG